MSIRLLRDGTVATLRKQIRGNLNRYRSGDFSFLDLDASLSLEFEIETDDSALSSVKMPDQGQLYETDNCIAVHEYLAQLSPYDARDERLWCYLSHTRLLAYARARWPIPADDVAAVKHIETHFFARTNRQIERDNAVSRLWWMAYLCTRVTDVPQRVALEALLYRADVRASIVERPTVSQSTPLFSVILKGLIRSLSGGQLLFERQTFRALMIEINSIGGFRLLDALSESELTSIFNDVVTQRLSLSSL